ALVERPGLIALCNRHLSGALVLTRDAHRHARRHRHALQHLAELSATETFTASEGAAGAKGAIGSKETATTTTIGNCSDGTGGTLFGCYFNHDRLSATQKLHRDRRFGFALLADDFRQRCD